MSGEERLSDATDDERDVLVVLRQSSPEDALAVLRLTGEMFIQEGFAAGRAAERADVVAWLDSLGSGPMYPRALAGIIAVDPQHVGAAEAGEPTYDGR